VRVHSPRKRAGVSSIPPVEADAPNVVRAIDFQFDSTIDGRAIKNASMIDEHARRSLLHVVERSITAERLVPELVDAFAAAGGPPKVLPMDKRSRIGFSSAATVLGNRSSFATFLRRPWNNGYTESFNNRLHKKCLNRKPLEHLVRGSRGHRRLPAPPPLGPGLPDAGRVICSPQVHPHPGRLRCQLNPDQNNP
jgi:putative transposase